MKYTNGEYVIDEDNECRLRNRVDAYQRETGTEDTILLTMVTARGLKANAYSSCVQKALEALHPERFGVQWFVIKPQVVKRLVKSMEAVRYD